ncbi:pre-mrna-splicing atp-dependent rna helicase prp28 [Phaffia rhodozyma]|uniref:RNA helicase n=1 Tax=Phaffia rhodozyma TaxID=264483 RepID=A0A0F7SLR0_PHARH|nr:pre-mrna-splicing atp-dependent rna helicase prp28 [Phaffia rhodozyma]
MPPLSVTDLLAKQKAEKEAASRPKFLTKAERAAIALEKRAKEIEDQKSVSDRARKEREELEQRIEEERRRNAPSDYRGSDYGSAGGRYGARGGAGANGHNGNSRGSYSGGHNERYQDRDREGSSFMGPPPVPSGPRGLAPSGPRSNSSYAPPTGPKSSKSIPPSSTPSQVQDIDPAIDLESIKARYLGIPTEASKKRKARKISDKKFVFDWDQEEDTALDTAEFGGGGVMLGGSVAGIASGGWGRAPEGSAEGKPGKGPDQFADALERRSALKSGGDDRHWTDKSLEEMKDRDWRIFREDFSIAARGGSIPLPMRNWAESNIPPQILDVIQQVGYVEPSPIQRQAIPIGLQNRDLIGIAETGSGKTAAFVIPMLTYIGRLPPLSDQNRHMGPYAMILAPTRELAQQIEVETKKFAAPMGYTCVSIVGGRSVDEQQYNLRDGAEIIIATPGRLKDVIDSHVLVLSQCSYVVMDEADRMVDLGFEEQLTFILERLPAANVKPEGVDVADLMGTREDGQPWRVTTLFSATMPPPVERLTRKYLRKPAVVTIGVAGQAVDTVEQRVEFVQGDEKKKQRMIQILRTVGLPPPMIIFCNQKKTADMVLKDIQRAGFSATTLHSGKNQEQREAALQSLRDGTHDILIATDLAGRGIDVPDVSLVINWQMSNTIEAYVHRIGRTGRAGKTGLAITFLGHEDEEVMYDLKNEISKSERSKMEPELARHPAAQQRIVAADKYKRKRTEAED